MLRRMMSRGCSYLVQSVPSRKPPSVASVSLTCGGLAAENRPFFLLPPPPCFQPHADFDLFIVGSPSVTFSSSLCSPPLVYDRDARNSNSSQEQAHSLPLSQQVMGTLNTCTSVGGTAAYPSWYTQEKLQFPLFLLSCSILNGLSANMNLFYPQLEAEPRKLTSTHHPSLHSPPPHHPLYLISTSSLSPRD